MERLHFGTTTVKPTERQRINSANLTCRKHVPGTWYTKCQKNVIFYYLVLYGQQVPPDPNPNPNASQNAIME